MEIENRLVKEKQYAHFISLGYFCSVALELERLGLRSESSPFDWCITADFSGVLNAIKCSFHNFLEFDKLEQSKQNLNHYKNTIYNIFFYHDFDEYTPLEKQLPSVRKKYQRRIERFYKSINQPTLFIRYISDEETDEHGKSKELTWIEENYSFILSVLREFNTENDILFIANNGVESSLISIFNVEKDENDVVARCPVKKNIDLSSYLDSLYFTDREKNLQFYYSKNTFFKVLFGKTYRKIKRMLSRIFLRKYTHNRQY